MLQHEIARNTGSQPMKNNLPSITVRGRKLSDLMAVNSHDDFHSYLLEHGIRRFLELSGAGDAAGLSALALCANYREARALCRFGFDRIVLTGLQSPDSRLAEVMEADSRVTFRHENCECLTLDSQSFDLVVCKEGLHHLPRPVLGFYEMLRLARVGSVIIEPFDTLLRRFLVSLGLASTFERDHQGNIDARTNYVFPWSSSMFRHLLDSYYLDSGYVLDLTAGWMTSKYNGNPSWLVRRLAASAGWLAGRIPGSRGNYMTAVILAGSQRPPEPAPLSNDDWNSPQGNE